jgi:hypothetical protein
MTVDQAYGYLGQSLAAGRLAQGYVIEAPPRGSGMELANRLMALLFCKDSAAPCGFCQGCKGVEKGTHPDLHRIEPEKKSRVIAVDAMRLFQQAFSRTSFAGGWKVGLIISADCCHASSANAFLKTLEEPPSKRCFSCLRIKCSASCPRSSHVASGFRSQGRTSCCLRERHMMPLSPHCANWGMPAGLVQWRHHPGFARF